MRIHLIGSHLEHLAQISSRTSKRIVVLSVRNGLLRKRSEKLLQLLLFGSRQRNGLNSFFGRGRRSITQRQDVLNQFVGHRDDRGIVIRNVNRPGWMLAAFKEHIHIVLADRERFRLPDVSRFPSRVCLLPCALTTILTGTSRISLGERFS